MKKLKCLIFCALSAVMSLVLAAGAYAAVTDVYAGDTVTETLGASKEHRYTFDVYDDAPGLLTVNLTNVSGEPGEISRVTLSIISGGKVISELKTDRDFKDEGYTVVEGLDAGSYTIKVSNPGFEAVNYSFTVDFKEYKYVEHEYNNTPVTATEVSMSKSCAGGVLVEKDEDWFVFEMPYDGYASFSMGAKQEKLFEFYDESLNKLASLYVETGEENSKFGRMGLLKGKYYLKVTNGEGSTDPHYAFMITVGESDSFESEPNGTAENADKVIFSKKYKGDITGIFDVDLYKFALSQKDTVTVKFYDAVASSTPHYSLCIKDKDGKAVIKKELASTCELVAELEKGEYFLEVSCPSEKNLSPLGYEFYISTKLSHSENGDSDSDKYQSADSSESPDSSESAENASESETDDEESAADLFSDVTPDKWYFKHISKAVSYGILNGVGNNLFDPEGKLTVAQALTVSARLHNLINGVDFDFDSAQTDEAEWYTGYVIYAIAAEIIEPEDFDSFSRPVTRKELAYLLCKTVGDKNTADAFEGDISDVPKNTKYADSIYKMYGAKVLEGDHDGMFRPDDELNRAELCAAAVRLYELFVAE